MLGLFAPSHMTYVAERSAAGEEPTLSEMTAAAIRHVEANPAGYFLMIEGGRIDHAHHGVIEQDRLFDLMMSAYGWQKGC